MLPEGDATDDAVRLQAVLDWLKASPGWLLILDNVDTPLALEAEKLIGQVTDGRLLMTSRLANFPGDVQRLELDLLPVDDAVDFLLERTAGHRRIASDDRANARELALDLGRLALALEHAGAYIVRHRASFSQYSDLWRGSRDKVMNWSDPTVTHYPRAVAVTWQTSVAQLTHPARHLLELLAWLAPEPVPEFLLEVPIPEADGNDLREALADLEAIPWQRATPLSPGSSFIASFRTWPAAAWTQTHPIAVSSRRCAGSRPALSETHGMAARGTSLTHLRLMRWP